MHRTIKEVNNAVVIIFLACVFLFASASAIADVVIGEFAPDYLGKDSQNEKIHISKHAGKVVIVNFWATWCLPCHKELPILSVIQQKAGHDRLRVFSVNFNEDRRTFKKAVDALKELDLTILRDTGSISRSYDVKALPFLVIVGKNGLVKFMQTGYDESEIPKLVNKINEALLEEYSLDNAEIAQLN